jgi:hypothetical protein
VSRPFYFSRSLENGGRLSTFPGCASSPRLNRGFAGHLQCGWRPGYRWQEGLSDRIHDATAAGWQNAEWKECD